ncbi:MAG: hypothetical protein ACXW2A_19230, partial [Burkholderiales bacterium]
VRRAALDDLVDAQLPGRVGHRVVELRRQERGDVGVELEAVLCSTVPGGNLESNPSIMFLDTGVP